MTQVTTVEVKYTHVEGWHVFTSDQFPGLYVASKDDRTAYDDVGPSLQKLLELEFDMKCEVTAEVPFDELMNNRGKKIRKESPKHPAPRQLSNQRFALYCAA